jgi:ribosomal protein S18 acetylase RimI-like enzyme
LEEIAAWRFGLGVGRASAFELVSCRLLEETVTYMFTDLLSDFGLRPVTLADRPAMDRYFQTLQSPLSDYTFSQLFTWRNSLRIAWKVMENHLCVFANGSGDLTLLLPPIGDTGSDRALSRSAEIMDQYNAVHACREKSRIEYVSEELLARFDHAKLNVTSQGKDYLYDVNRMIDLAGGDLASKRQAKNRFMRNYRHRIERYDFNRHFGACRELLNCWKERQDSAHAADTTSSAIKRTKESLATQLTLEHAAELGLQGLVVYAAEQGSDAGETIKAFTFGEALGSDQSSIVIEKTDLECKGLAQFIYSEFCRTAWANRPLVNAGDDWGLESLAWTKSSYRPVKLLQKFSMTSPVRVAVAAGGSSAETIAEHPVIIRPVRREDLPAISALERGCFSVYNLNKRQLHYLQQRQSAVFLVAEVDGKIVGESIALVRHHKHCVSGRAYSLAIDPAFRGRKIGEKLMREMIEQLRLRNVRRIYLEVEATNVAAIGLYRRLGFSNIGTLADYYGEGKHGAHMLYDASAFSPMAA